jgi:hypothetical protein
VTESGVTELRLARRAAAPSHGRGMP